MSDEQPAHESAACACNWRCRRLCRACGDGYDADGALERGCDCWCHVADEQRRKTDARRAKDGAP